MTHALEAGKQPNAVLQRLVAYARVPVGIIALAGLLLSASVHIASLRGADVAFTWPSVWLLHYALFPIIVVAVITVSAVAGKKRLGLRDFLALIPAWALALLAVSLVYALANLLVFAPPSGGATLSFSMAVLFQRSWHHARSERRPVPPSAQRVLAPFFQCLDLSLSCFGHLFARREAPPYRKHR